MTERLACRTCGQPIHPHNGTGTGYRHDLFLPVWCDDKAPTPRQDTSDDA